jgi:hypothetical protein
MLPATGRGKGNQEISTGWSMPGAGTGLEINTRGKDRGCMSIPGRSRLMPAPLDSANNTTAICVGRDTFALPAAGI